MAKQDLTSRSVAPLFVLLTLVFAAAVLSRFDGFAGQIPGQVHGAMLAASFPLLLIAAAVERRVAYDSSKTMPLWMQIDSRPIKYTFTLALTYLGIVALQVFEVELGVIDPSPPESFPQQQRLLWFLGFSFGMSFANYLVAAGVLIPALRLITAPFSRLPGVIGLPLVALLGLGLGWLSLGALARAEDVRAITGYVEALKEQPMVAIAVAVALVVGPIVIEAIWQRE
jgi:hypothetical protein